MIQLLKILPDSWEKAKGYLRLDLDYIESALNTRWAITFTNTNTLQPGTIPGDSTLDSRYVSNQGSGHTLLWDQVDLSNGVKNRLPFSYFVQATVPGVLVGRRSTSVGDFEQITLGTGIAMHGTVLDVVPGQIAAQFMIARDGEDGESGAPGLPGTAGAAGATGPTGPAGVVGPPGYDGEKGEDGPMGPPGPVGATGASGSGSGIELQPVWIDGGEPSGYSFFGYNVLDAGAP